MLISFNLVLSWVRAHSTDTDADKAVLPPQCHPDAASAVALPAKRLASLDVLREDWLIGS